MANTLLYLRPGESIPGIQYFQPGHSLSTLAHDYYRTRPDSQAYEGKGKQPSPGL